MHTNKVILVTGTSSGLGASVAALAAQAGHTVYASMRDTTKGAALTESATAAGHTLHVVGLDVADPAQPADVINTIVAEHGHIDAVIANAGIGYVRTTEQAREEDVLALFNTNFMGVYRCVKAALPHMRDQGAGRFIAVSSVGGLIGQPFNEFYCASKFALEGYFESLASYVAPIFGVHFSLVEPGGIESEFANTILQKVMADGGFPDDAYKPIIDKYIGGRGERNSDGVFQSPQQVAAVVMQCLTAESPPIRIRTSPWSEQFTELKTAADPDGKRAQAMVFDSMIGAD